MYWITTHLEVVIIVVLTLLAAIVILQQRRTPQSTAAWLLFIIILPWIAVPLFLALGFRKQSTRYAPVDFAIDTTLGLTKPIHALDATMQNFGLPAATAGQHLQLLHRPDAAYAEVMALIAGARQSLDVVFYIVADDATGRAFIEALSERARAGVQVRLLLDRMGTGRGPTNALRNLRAAGGVVHFYSPLLQLPGPGHLNLRNHRKMIIADGARVFSGGMNIAAHYLSPVAHKDHWADLSFILKGRAVQAFGNVFRSDWEVASRTTLDPAPAVSPDTAGSATIQLVPAGPDVLEDPLHDGLIRALHMAEARIWLVTPYFIPTEALGNALAIASRRGVDVRVMVPARSNQRLADFARGAYLRDLQDAGGKVLYYQPGMIHAKAGIIDDIGFIGSANFDVRSMLLNFEVTMFVYDAGSVATLSTWFHERASDATQETSPAGLLRRVAEGLFRLGAPIL